QTVEMIQRQTLERVVVSCAIGKVVKTDDPEGLGRIQLEFDWDGQGAHSAYWALPIYPLNGDLGTDVPQRGEFVVCLFQYGSRQLPLYLGVTRGKPKKDLVQELVEASQDSIHAAVAEVVEANFKALRDYVQKHTHDVVFTGQVMAQTAAGPAPVTGTVQSLMPREAMPALKRVGALRVRLHKKNKPKDNL
ncbi:phage baseplate assembly protein V, partial [Deinococcus kurensis]|uniref:phage baseplate assembly protein V n=1 Tax=Deinococcus kurensis TaxID=2662757 RepID=UPI001F47A33D